MQVQDYIKKSQSPMYFIHISNEQDHVLGYVSDVGKVSFDLSENFYEAMLFTDIDCAKDIANIVSVSSDYIAEVGRIELKLQTV